LEAHATVTVTAEPGGGTPVHAVSVAPGFVALQLQQQVQLTATPRDAAGNPLPDRPVAWSSSNAGVASVSADGLVTAHAAGDAVVTATSEGRTGAAVVSVTFGASPVASVTVTPHAVQLIAGEA